MFKDRLLEVSTNQAVTATAVSASSIDRGAAAASGPGTTDAFTGEPMDLWVQIKPTADGGESFNTLTSLNIEAISATDAALTGSVVAHGGRVIALTNLAVGNKIRVATLVGPSKQYIGARYTVVGTNPTTGKITAWFAPTNFAEANPASLT